MHAVRLELLQMQDFVDDVKSRGVECFAFSDLFLQDIRS